MSQTLNINNFSDNNILGATSLTADINAGIEALPVVNSADFANQIPVLVGTPGDNNAEIIEETSPANSTTITLVSNTNLNHFEGDQVLALFGNTINVYRAADIYGTGVQPPDTNFTLLTNITISPSQTTSTYTDASGGATYWYKFTYYNNVTSAETAIADSIAVSQITSTNYTSLDSIRSKAGFTNNVNITDARIDEKRQAAQNRVNGALLPVYVFPLPTPTNPIIAEISRDLAAAYLLQDVYRTTNPSLAADGEELEMKTEAGLLQDLITKRVVLVNATFVDQTIAGGNGVSGYPDNTLSWAGQVGGEYIYREQGGRPISIFYPGMKY